MNTAEQVQPPVLLGKVHRMPPCGCNVIGDGTLQHPVEIQFCPLHAAPDSDAIAKVMETALASVQRKLIGAAQAGEFSAAEHHAANMRMIHTVWGLAERAASDLKQD